MRLMEVWVVALCSFLVDAGKPSTMDAVCRRRDDGTPRIGSVGRASLQADFATALPASWLVTGTTRSWRFSWRWAGTRNLPFAPQLLKEAGDAWRDELSLANSSVDNDIGMEPEPGEFFCWRTIGEHLRILGDADWIANLNQSFRTRVRLGHGVVMPRLPALFKRKVQKV